MLDVREIQVLQQGTLWFGEMCIAVGGEVETALFGKMKDQNRGNLELDFKVYLNPANLQQ